MVPENSILSLTTDDCKLPTPAQPALTTDDCKLKTTATRRLVVVAVLAMILLQVFASRTTSKREPPGPARGDIVLGKDALPETIGDWKQVSFVPAAPPEELPEGQFWWVHQWQYSDGQHVAIVSLDQLGQNRWHELSDCYRTLDWEIKDRTIRTESDTSAPFVVVMMTRQTGETGILVFSIFFEDGSWATPPDINLAPFDAKKLDQSIWGKIRIRLVPKVDSGHTRALQCQVFVPLKVGVNFTASDIEECIQLHLETRIRLLAQWADFG